jgi:hypothetical protein
MADFDVSVSQIACPASLGLPLRVQRSEDRKVVLVEDPPRDQYQLRVPKHVPCVVGRSYGSMLVYSKLAVWPLARLPVRVTDTARTPPVYCPLKMKLLIRLHDPDSKSAEPRAARRHCEGFRGALLLILLVFTCVGSARAWAPGCLVNSNRQSESPVVWAQREKSSSSASMCP